jgi:hypothetical protein
VAPKIVGNIVGERVGLLLGSNVRGSVGDRFVVGKEVGWRVGVLVGARVGAFDGDDDVGDFEGKEVSSAGPILRVGDIVGRIESWALPNGLCDGLVVATVRFCTGHGTIGTPVVLNARFMHFPLEPSQ